MAPKTETPTLFNVQNALIAIMIAEGLSDNGREFLSISRIVDHLPIFHDYDQIECKLLLRQLLIYLKKTALMHFWLGKRVSTD